MARGHLRGPRRRSGAARKIGACGGRPQRRWCRRCQGGWQDGNTAGCEDRSPGASAGGCALFDLPMQRCRGVPSAMLLVGAARVIGLVGIRVLLGIRLGNHIGPLAQQTRRHARPDAGQYGQPRGYCDAQPTQSSALCLSSPSKRNAANTWLIWEIGACGCPGCAGWRTGGQGWLQQLGCQFCGLASSVNVASFQVLFQNELGRAVVTSQSSRLSAGRWFHPPP